MMLEEQRAEPEVKFSGGRIRYFQHIRWLTCPKSNTEHRVAREGDARMVRESEVKFSVLAPRAAVVCYVSETGVSQMRGWVGGRYVGTVGFCVGTVTYAVGTVVGTVVFYSRNGSFHEFRLRF